MFTEAHRTQLRTQGYCIVERWLDDATLERARRDLFTVAPTWEEYVSQQGQPGAPKPRSWLDFPYKNDAANHIALHPELIGFAEAVLGTTEILLAHSEMLIKYAGAGDYDQQMHMDWGNNTLVVPQQDGFDQLASITYYDDVTLDLGPTKFVAWSDTEGFRHRREWPRSEAPALYECEQSVLVPAGSIFLYGMRSFHRGSAFTANEGARFSQHIAFRRKRDTWNGWRGYAAFCGQPTMDSLLPRLSPRQREMLGFPAPGDPYWTEYTLEGVARRYPEMDMTPYRSAMRAQSSV